LGLNKLTLTIAKPERRADVLEDAFNLALLKCSLRQERALKLSSLDMFGEIKIKCYIIIGPEDT